MNPLFEFRSSSSPGFTVLPLRCHQDPPKTAVHMSSSQSAGWPWRVQENLPKASKPRLFPHNTKTLLALSSVGVHISWGCGRGLLLTIFFPTMCLQWETKVASLLNEVEKVTLWHHSYRVTETWKPHICMVEMFWKPSTAHLKQDGDGEKAGRDLHNLQPQQILAAHWPDNVTQMESSRFRWRLLKQERWGVTDNIDLCLVHLHAWGHIPTHMHS